MRPACHMQLTMRIARRCTVLQLPRALPMQQTDERTRGLVGRGRGGASPTPPLFWTEIRPKVSPLLQLVTY